MKKVFIILFLILAMVAMWFMRKSDLKACNGNKACEHRVLQGY